DLAALLRAAGGRDAALLVLTSGAVHVRPGDRVDLASCALPGLVRTAVIEAVLPTVRQVDLPAERDRWADTTRAELADRSRTGVLAVRDDLRWEPRLGRVDRSEVRERPPVVAGGRYLVTGGLGGLAHDLASYLLAAYGVRLLLVGRSEPRGVKAERLTELAGLGEVAYRALDVADAVGLREAVDAAELRWGAPLDGVLHVAGGDPSAQWERLEQHTLRRESAETFDALSRAKVAGTLAVADVLESRPQASLVLFGSVNGEFGGHSFGAYSTANAFLVGFADHWRHERGRDVRCLAWSMWTDVGLNRDRPVGPVRRRGFRPIRGQEGLAAFLTAAGLDDHYVLIGLDADHPQVVAELEPTAVRAREVLVAYTTEDDDTDTDIDPLRDGLDPLLRRSPVPVRFRKLPHLPTDATGAVDTTQLLLDADAARARRKPYVAPATDLEHRLAAIWSEVLNRPTPGRDDTFYELGGNSMRAVRLLARMSEELPVAVTLHQLYDKATIGELASLIETGGPGVE
ncbi:MAG: SDR family NAD(P)-dependent oxidoreductase, partial [Saccharothrix sp.]|nr:SDR family NAD(P)-dependent oxidoreductase [Saccharothrix sp.]